MSDMLLLPWAIVLGLLGAGTVVLLKMWNQDEWIKPKPRMIAGLVLGPIASFLMWMMGDGVNFVGLLAYFATGASAPTFLVEILEKYSKSKKVSREKLIAELRAEIEKEEKEKKKN